MRKRKRKQNIVVFINSKYNNTNLTHTHTHTPNANIIVNNTDFVNFFVFPFTIYLFGIRKLFSYDDFQKSRTRVNL